MKQLIVIAETKEWIAINKPSGLNVEQLWDYPSAESQVRSYLEAQGKREPFVGVVHRLDRPVSGVLLLAKKKSTLKLLNEQFAQRAIQKTYWTITEGIPSSQHGQLIHYLEKDAKNQRAIAHHQARKNSHLAKLSYQVLQTQSDYALLEVIPHSGKYHQIRTQLATAGFPILGDHKYGAKQPDADTAIALHARSLIFYDDTASADKHLVSDVPHRECWKMWNTPL